MTVYFYHTQDLQMILPRLDAGEFPPHLLYGASKLPQHGIDVVWHRSRLGLSRWRLMLYNAWQILTRRDHFDAIYATHYRGLELIVLLRALGLYRRPIIIWHHQPIVTPSSRWREWLGRIFYRGFDHMFFFSQNLIDTSLRSRKARPERIHLGHWGMDVPAWAEHASASASAADATSRPFVFIHSGKEMRDIPTLIEAFRRTGEQLELYINSQNGSMNYAEMLGTMQLPSNVHVHVPDRLVPHEISLKVMEADCVCICCQRTKYTVGLTTVVEALALGKPLICSRNPQIPVDIDREQCGISVDYYDVDGWERAIRHMVAHPDEARVMGRRAQQLARTTYNDERVAAEVASVIRQALHA